MKALTKEQIASIKPIKIDTSYDIRKAVMAFMPHTIKDDTISAELRGMDDGKKVTFALTAPLNCDVYTQFMQGMTMLRNRFDIIAKHGETARKVLMIDGHAWVDNIIKTRLGGVREGLRIRWIINEGTFYFDPFTGKLTKCEPASTS